MNDWVAQEKLTIRTHKKNQGLGCCISKTDHWDVAQEKLLLVIWYERNQLLASMAFVFWIISSSTLNPKLNTHVDAKFSMCM